MRKYPLPSVRRTEQIRERLAATAQAVKMAEAEVQRTAGHAVKFKFERDQADQATSTAREESVRLSGQVSALQTQTGELLRTVGPRPESAQSEVVKGT